MAPQDFYNYRYTRGSLRAQFYLSFQLDASTILRFPRHITYEQIKDRMVRSLFTRCKPQVRTWSIPLPRSVSPNLPCRPYCCYMCSLGSSKQSTTLIMAKTISAILVPQSLKSNVFHWLYANHEKCSRSLR